MPIINIPFEVTDQFLAEVLETALTGASPWANVIYSGKAEDSGYNRAVLMYNNKELHANTGTIRTGLERILARSFKWDEDLMAGIGDPHWNVGESVKDAVTYNDSVRLDTEEADIVLQVGLFNEILYYVDEEAD
jgi:hypothetical protein